MTWDVKELTDKAQILEFLMSDRIYAAYAIGDLTPGLFEQAEWFGAEGNGRLRALAMHFRGVMVPVLFLMGDKEGIRAILEKNLPPEPVYINCRSEHMPVVHGVCQWDEPIAMWRMSLTGKPFHPISHNCVRLTSGHAKQLKDLYDQGGMPGFTEEQVERGIFYGLFNKGILIAAAGTHLVSPTYNVAAVGNVFTHQDHRGKGLGTATTNAVLTELMELGIRDIILNVAQDNKPAIHIYERSGFERYCPFFEGRVLLRKTAG